jgi:hypothetical protein
LISLEIDHENHTIARGAGSVVTFTLEEIEVLQVALGTIDQRTTVRVALRNIELAADDVIPGAVLPRTLMRSDEFAASSIAKVIETVCASKLSPRGHDRSGVTLREASILLTDFSSASAQSERHRRARSCHELRQACQCWTQN